MEKNVFTDARVRETFQDFVVVKLFVDEKYAPDADEVAARNKALQERLAGGPQLPAYVVVEPGTETVVDVWGYRREHVSDPGAFARRLEDGLRKVQVLRGN